MSTQYKATCKCGATVDVPYSDNFYEWLKSHNECLKHPSKREWVWLSQNETDELARTMVKGDKSVNWLVGEITTKLKELNT